MNFRFFIENDSNIYIPLRFDSLLDAKKFVFDHIKSYKNLDLIMIAFIVKDDDKYIIYYDIIRSNLFIDDTIDYIKQWQEDHNTYIECIMLPHYGDILTIEIVY